MRWLLALAAFLQSVASAAATGEGEGHAGAGRFRTPSGDVQCAFTVAEARCGIAHHVLFPPGRGDWGANCSIRALAPRGMPRTECILGTLADPSHAALPPGTTWEGNGVCCTVLDAEVRCRNAEGRGFDLSRPRATLYLDPSPTESRGGPRCRSSG